MWPWPRTLAFPMCAASKTSPLTRRWKVTVACFLVTVAGLTEMILTLIAGLDVAGLDVASLGAVGAAQPVTRKRMAAARMADAPTRVVGGFMVNSLPWQGWAEARSPAHVPAEPHIVLPVVNRYCLL